MKLKTLIFLPVALVALTGCELFAKKVDSQEANKQVVEAMQKATTEEHKAIQATISAELSAIDIEYLDSIDQPKAKTETLLDFDASAKIKNMNTETVQMAGNLQGRFSSKLDDVEQSKLEGNAGLYYDAGWLYADYKITTKKTPTGPTVTEENKVKANIGPLDFTQGTEIVPIDPKNTEQLEALLNGLDNINARIIRGELHVTYELTQDDLIDATTNLFITTFSPNSEPTSEEYATIREGVSEGLNKSINIRTLKIDLVLNKEGLLGKIEANLDLDTFSETKEYNETTLQQEVVKRNKITIKGGFSLGMKYDGDVTFELPDFTSYTEAPLPTI